MIPKNNYCVITIQQSVIADAVAKFSEPFPFTYFCHGSQKEPSAAQLDDKNSALLMDTVKGRTNWCIA